MSLEDVIKSAKPCKWCKAMPILYLDEPIKIRCQNKSCIGAITIMTGTLEEVIEGWNKTNVGNQA